MAQGTDIWGTIVDTADSIIGGIGANADASGVYNQAKADAVAANVQISAAKAAADIERKKENQKLIQTLIYSIVALLFVVTIAMFSIKLLKTKK